MERKMKTRELVTTGRAAELLGLSDSYVRQLVAAGKLPVAQRVEGPAGEIALLDRAAVEQFGRTPRPGPGRPPRG